MIFVTITVGGWSGSSLNLKTSWDGGRTWSRSRRLTLSPFFNISELVKGRPMPVKGHVNNGSEDHFAVPIYHEFLGYFPEILWISFSRQHDKIIYNKSRMSWGTSFIQPSIVPLGTHSAKAYYRSLSSEKRVATAQTDDGGRCWSSPTFLNLPNPDSAVDALPLSENRIIMVFNDSANSRGILQLAVSDDRGLSWIRIHTLEDGKDEEFSYPYMIRGRNGSIHLVYTWRRERIKHITFNEAWVDRELARTLQK
jgi:predicted neuraminidase